MSVRRFGYTCITLELLNNYTGKCLGTCTFYFDNVPSNGIDALEECCIHLYFFKATVLLFGQFARQQSDRERRDMKSTEEKEEAANVAESITVRWSVHSLAQHH